MKSPLALAWLAVVAIVMSGCSGHPDPVDTTPGFSSEADAFAAAEQTYRNYVDALNRVDLSDPSTFEAVYSWTTGDANAGARKSFTQMHADGWVVSGESAYDGFALSSFSPNNSTSIATAVVCLDVTQVNVVGPDGASKVPATRTNRQPAALTFVNGATSTRLVISKSDATAGKVCG